MNLRGALTAFILLTASAWQCVASSPRTSYSKVSPVLFVRSFTIPEYRPIARQAAVQGDVSAIALISADGNVESISDVEGPALLQGQAVDALKSWKFTNLTNQPIMSRITFRWKLEGPGTDQYSPVKISGQLPGTIEIVTNPPAPLDGDWIKAPKKKN
jgi:hypothetical protein